MSFTPDRLRELFHLGDRVAIITGGTRGIGRAIAEGFVAAGASVAVASRKADVCAETAGALRNAGGDAIGVPTHLGDLGDCRRLVEVTIERFGRLDIVVNNGATSLAQPLGHYTPEAWTKVFDVDLRGPAFLVQDALPYLRDSAHASVINVISAGAYLFAADTSMYSSAKAGLASLTRSMAAAYVGDGVRVNALAPGTVDTDMVRNTPHDMQERMARASLMRRMASPEELVGPALFLASDASSFMTGQALLVDGGMVPR